MLIDDILILLFLTFKVSLVTLAYTDPCWHQYIISKTSKNWLKLVSNLNQLQVAGPSFADSSVVIHKKKKKKFSECEDDVNSYPIFFLEL